MNEPQISYRGPEWFCGIASPGCEKRAQDGCEERGYRTLVLWTRQWVNRSNRRVVSARPVLGRYIFIEVDYPRQGFGPLRDVRGLTEVLNVGGFPKPMPRETVEGFLLRQLTGEWDAVTNEGIPLRARVMVVEGQFAGTLATVMNAKRNLLTVKLDGAKKTVPIFEHSLRPMT